MWDLESVLPTSFPMFQTFLDGKWIQPAEITEVSRCLPCAGGRSTAEHQMWQVCCNRSNSTLIGQYCDSETDCTTAVSRTRLNLYVYYTVLHMSIFGLCELAHQLMLFKERHGQFGEAKYSYPSRFEVPRPVPWAKTSKIRMIWFADSVLGHLNALNI